MGDEETKNLVTVLGAVALFITATLVPAVIAILNALKTGQDKQEASAVIYAEQKNRELAQLGATPVTNQSPPMGTGDGRIDAAVANQMSTAPTSPSTVPAAEPPTPFVPTDPPAPTR